MNSIWLSEKKQNNQYNQLAEDKTTDVYTLGYIGDSKANLDFTNNMIITN